MIFDHGVRRVDGVTRVRMKALLGESPLCAECGDLALGVWVNHVTGRLTPVCSEHLHKGPQEPSEDDGEDCS